VPERGRTVRRSWLLLALAPAVACATARSSATAGRAASETTVRILAFSDYHSHALPFYSEGRPGQGGIARAIRFLKEAKAGGDALVVSGGDMLNRDTPAWSDEFRCVEWPWLNGILDAMALGNHELDYGPEVFAACRASARFPVLSANLVGADGTPLLTAAGAPYLVKEVGGVRIGIFALAGSDLPKLVRAEDLPPGAAWRDPVLAAHKVVRALREHERVAAVVLIGHQRREDDLALAQAVPGIDLILGTHSHDRGELERLPGTSTWTLSPYQYLAYLADVRLRFRDGVLGDVTGGLVRMDETRPQDPATAAEVARLQKELAARRPDRFQVLGRAALTLTDDGVTTGESLIGNWATEMVRRAARVRAFFATASSFRGGIPEGDVDGETLRTAIPYRNRVVTAEMTGRQLLEWLAVSLSQAGGNGFSQQSGLRYQVRAGRAEAVEVLEDPERPAAGYAPLDPEAVYRVGTTDFQADIAPGYRERFATARGRVDTAIEVHGALAAALAAGPASARLDGRCGDR
jgi:5'-nucleotidase